MGASHCLREDCAEIVTADVAVANSQTVDYLFADAVQQFVRHFA